MIGVFVITSSIRNSSSICEIWKIWVNLNIADELSSYWPAFEEELDWWHGDIHVEMEEIVRRNVWEGRLKRTEWSTGLRKWWKWKGKELEQLTTWWFKRELIMLSWKKKAGRRTLRNGKCRLHFYWFQLPITSSREVI